MVHTEMIKWDWKEQPDLEDLAAALGRFGVYCYNVDTGSDQLAIVLSDTALSQAEISDTYMDAA